MATITPIKSAAETAIEQAFAGAKATLPAAAMREEAFRRYAAKGLPHRRVEEWKYTDLRALMREAAPLAAKPSADVAAKALLDAKGFGIEGATRIGIVDGHVMERPAGLPVGVTLVSLAEALTAQHPLLARLGAVEIAQGNHAIDLNGAFMTDGAVLHVAAGTQVETPLHIAFVTLAASAVATATRSLIVVEEGASLTLLESHESADGIGHQPNHVMEMIVGDEAVITHVRLNAESDKALALSTLTAHLGRKTKLFTTNAVFGSAVARHQVFVKYAGADAHASINGTAMLRGSEHSDTTLVVDHAEPGGESRELFRTIVDDDATGVFQGKIIVRQKAQKTDGQMMSGALLLGEGSTMYNKPELEIFADDVLCAHGATCGALDDDLLFYLMARGLPKAEAEALMIQAFVGEVVEAIEHEGVREGLAARVEGWLKARAGLRHL